MGWNLGSVQVNCVMAPRRRLTSSPIKIVTWHVIYSFNTAPFLTMPALSSSLKRVYISSAEASNP